MQLERSGHDKLARPAWGLLVGAALCLTIGTGPSLAADDDDEPSLDTRILRGVLEGLGLRRDAPAIDYRERSPLVVPPSRDLPAPETDNIAQRNPAFPEDADVRRKREIAKRNATSSRVGTTDSRALADADPISREELDRGRGRTRDSGPTPDGEMRPKNPSALGFTGFSFGSVFGAKKEETTAFTREPSRSTLTQPPTGYQTPSANYPYGVNTRNVKGKAETIEDRAARDQR
jgi:hypothetical protein